MYYAQFADTVECDDAAVRDFIIFIKGVRNHVAYHAEPLPQYDVSGAEHCKFLFRQPVVGMALPVVFLGEYHNGNCCRSGDGNENQHRYQDFFSHQWLRNRFGDGLLSLEQPSIHRCVFSFPSPVCLRCYSDL